MAYFRNIAKSADWLALIQNPDDGWGLTPGQASSLVNTAEAIFVLGLLGDRYSKEVQRGIDYIRANWRSHIEERGEKLRFIAFPLFVICQLGKTDLISPDEIAMKDWLLSQRNDDDGGWGAETGAPSDLYSTFLAIQALYKFEIPENTSNQVRLWILGNAGERGWGFESSAIPTRSATAYAILALEMLGETDDPKIHIAQSFLLQTDHWDDEEANYAGTLWKHCTHSNVISALAVLEDDLFSPTIAEGIRYSNRLIHEAGGWMETRDGRDNRTVRSQYWAAFYSEKLVASFDPSKFVPRVDAERTEDTLQAPEFQHFFIKSQWATVIPTTVFRLAVYAMFLAGTFFAAEFNQLVNIQVTAFLQILGFFLLAVAFALMRKRPIVFPKSYQIAVLIVAFLGALNLFFGVTIEKVFSYIKYFLAQIGTYLSQLG